MKRNFIALLIILSLQGACSSSVIVPQVGATAPCQIQSNAQVEKAINDSLKKQAWLIQFRQAHVIEAQKTLKEKKINIAIVYGYRGFSIEYVDSQGMNYDPDNDSIDMLYKKWVERLKQTIQENLIQQVKEGPPIKCLG